MVSDHNGTPPTDAAPRGRWRTMLADVHFWIPLGVLVGGLILLRWIAAA